MKKILIPILISLITFLACSKQENIPENIIKKEVLVEIIIDLQKAESLTYQKKDSIKQKRDIRLEKYCNDVFKKHNTTKEEYKRTLDYYSNTPEALEEIINEIIKKLNQDVS